MEDQETVYEYRPNQPADPKARERVVWIIFGGGGTLMATIALVVALTAEGGFTEGLKKTAIFIGLGILIAILPLGLRHGIRAQNARQAAFSISVSRDGVLEVDSVQNVAGGRMDKPTFEPVEHRVPLGEVAQLRFDEERFESGQGTNRYKSVSYFLLIDRLDGTATKVLLPPNSLGQQTGLPLAEQERLHSAAAPYLGRKISG